MLTGGVPYTSSDDGDIEDNLNSLERRIHIGCEGKAGNGEI